MTTPDLAVDMEIDDFATFLFIKNKHNAIVDLSMGNVENTKDLFCFCIDLLCKGLIILFGDGIRVDLDTITQDNFAVIKQKMYNAGILVKLEVFPNTDKEPNTVNVADIDNAKDDMNMDDYHLKIVGNDIIYYIQFSVERRI